MQTVSQSSSAFFNCFLHLSSRQLQLCLYGSYTVFTKYHLLFLSHDNLSGDQRKKLIRRVIFQHCLVIATALESWTTSGIILLLRKNRSRILPLSLCNNLNIIFFLPTLSWHLIAASPSSSLSSYRIRHVRIAKSISLFCKLSRAVASFTIISIPYALSIIHTALSLSLSLSLSTSNFSRYRYTRFKLNRPRYSTSTRINRDLFSHEVTRFDSIRFDSTWFCFLFRFFFFQFSIYSTKSEADALEACVNYDAILWLVSITITVSRETENCCY